MLKSGAAEQEAPLRRADRLMAEAMDIVDAARKQGAQIRLTGGLAIRRYCTDLDFMDREYSDIDFIGLSSQTKELHDVFTALGYTENRYVTQSTDAGQLQYVKIEALEQERDQALEGRHRRRTSRRSSTTSTSSWTSCAWTTTWT